MAFLNATLRLRDMIYNYIYNRTLSNKILPPMFSQKTTKTTHGCFLWG
jgi:hypothetical protein